MSRSVASADLGMKTVYLDHAAAAPLDPEVYEAMLPYFSDSYANPSSMHASGRNAAAAIRTARDMVARVVKCDPEEIIFTGSGTESDNLALMGGARRHKSRGMHIIISAIEHKAVTESAKVLEAEGFQVSIAPVDEYGMVDPKIIASMVTNETTIISVILANNEIGTVEPVAEVARLLESRKKATGFPLLHTDACQAAGYVALDVATLGVDLMTLNGSKSYGPRGVGVLYKKSGVLLSPTVVGGHQEGGLRAGTESVPLIVGMAKALQKAEALREEETKRLSELRVYFIQGLQAAIPDIIVNGHPENHVPHILHVTVPKIEGESMVLLLDQAGIACATGSACSTNDLRPSHVLSAIGHDNDLIHGSLRFSMGRGTDKDAIEYVLSVFPGIVSRLKAASALTTRVVYEKTR